MPSTRLIFLGRHPVNASPNEGFAIVVEDQASSKAERHQRVPKPGLADSRLLGADMSYPLVSDTLVTASYRSRRRSELGLAPRKACPLQIGDFWSACHVP